MMELIERNVVRELHLLARPTLQNIELVLKRSVLLLQNTQVRVQLLHVLNRTLEDADLGVLCLLAGGGHQVVELHQLGVEPVLAPSLGGVVQQFLLTFPLKGPAQRNENR